MQEARGPWRWLSQRRDLPRREAPSEWLQGEVFAPSKQQPGVPSAKASDEEQHPRRFFQRGEATPRGVLFRAGQSSSIVLCLSDQHCDALRHKNVGELWLGSNGRFLLFKTVSPEISNKRKPS